MTAYKGEWYEHKLRHDVVISSTDKGDRVGVYFEDMPDKVLFEVHPALATKIVQLWNVEREMIINS